MCSVCILLCVCMYVYIYIYMFVYPPRLPLDSFPEYIVMCWTMGKSISFLRKCMHARIQGPRVWKNI